MTNKRKNRKESLHLSETQKGPPLRANFGIMMKTLFALVLTMLPTSINA